MRKPPITPREQLQHAQHQMCLNQIGQRLDELSTALQPMVRQNCPTMNGMRRRMITLARRGNKQLGIVDLIANMEKLHGNSR